MRRIYHFPDDPWSDLRWITPTGLAVFGAIFVTIGLNFEEFFLYLAVPPFFIAIALVGYKNDVTIDTTTGTITSSRKFFFYPTKEVFHKSEFKEIYVTKRIGEPGSGGLGNIRRATYYKLTLSGNKSIDVDTFLSLPDLNKWLDILSKELELPVAEMKDYVDGFSKNFGMASGKW
ncbi:MAG: hypothetical protein RH948_08465 [Cyclobacteriaceae bacterium]